MKEGYTHIAFILDSSSSMSGGWNTVKKGYRTMIEDQQQEDTGDCTFSFYTFSTYLKLVEDFTPIQEVSGALKVNPSGNTALFDAVGAVIDKTGATLAEMAEDDRPEKVLVMIQTDGQENSSTERNGSQIREMIEEQRGKYNWQFVFLGENEDCLHQAHAIGIGASHTSTYSSARSLTKGATKLVSDARTSATCDYADFEVSEAARSVLNEKETKTPETSVKTD